MEGLGVAASVIAVVDLSAKVASLCFQYSTAVANARTDIKRLYERVKCLDTTLQHARHLLEASSSQPISATREIVDQLQACEDELQMLRTRLEPRTARKAMRRFGLRALKWPFSSKDTEAIMGRLQRYQSAIEFSLHVDQTKLLLGINEGIENLSLQSNEDASIARKPHFIMPFPRDMDFVDRPVIQLWVREQYAGPTSRMALVSLGGFGKSQVAIEFAYEIQSNSPGTSVFWVHGSTKARFEESYRCLADNLTLPRRHDPKVDILALVRDWLQRVDVAPWIMILDNADDLNTFFDDTGPVPMASYIPKAGHGKILITSRNVNVAEKLTGSHNAIMRLPTMDKTQALQLFRKKLNPSLEEGMAADLVDALDCIPLAVNQAAAYINRRTPRVSTRSYLESLRASAKKKSSLLDFDAGDLRRHESVSNSVVVTWQLTFEQIRRERRTAANLLSLMCFFNPQNIPEYMLSGYAEPAEANTDGDDKEDEDFEDDLDVLRAYSLINISGITGFCDMHPLVQFCMQRWLSTHNDLSRWKSLFLHLASIYFPAGNFETWAECQILLPHIQAILHEQQPLDEQDVLKWASLLTNASWYFVTTGDYFKAETTIKKAFDARNMVLGADHPDTMRSMAHLASIFWNQSRWEEAEKLDVQVMETRKTKLGEDHPSTIVSISNLASTLSNQGRWEEAEKLELQVMESCIQRFGENHLHTLKAIDNLASTYRGQGRWEEAEKLQVQALKIGKRELGEDHPDVLMSMANLMSTYIKQGRREEAEKLGVQVMEKSKIMLGQDHPNTLTSMANLALTYIQQGRWEEAEKLGVQVMQVSKVKLGEDHPDTLISIGNLASTFANQGRWDEAEKLSLQVLETRKAKLGEDHPSTLRSMGKLALMYRKQGLLEEAEKLEVRVTEIMQVKLGEDHPNS